ncbi:MAG: hypothetical protein ACLSU0_07475, partial [Oscillospiraceae bacterium]
FMRPDIASCLAITSASTLAFPSPSPLPPSVSKLSRGLFSSAVFGAAAPSVSSAFVPFALPSARRTSKKENFSVGLLSFYQIFIKYNLFLIA